MSDRVSKSFETAAGKPEWQQTVEKVLSDLPKSVFSKTLLENPGSLRVTLSGPHDYNPGGDAFMTLEFNERKLGLAETYSVRVVGTDKEFFIESEAGRQSLKAYVSEVIKLDRTPFFHSLNRGLETLRPDPQ